MKDNFENKERERLEDLVREVQQKNSELEKHRQKIELQNKKSRQRTIELFGKMIDLKKAKKIIMFQNEELERKNEEINKKRAALAYGGFQMDRTAQLSTALPHNG